MSGRRTHAVRSHRSQRDYKITRNKHYYNTETVTQTNIIKRVVNKLKQLLGFNTNGGK